MEEKQAQQIKDAHHKHLLLYDWQSIYGKILGPRYTYQLNLWEKQLMRGDLQPTQLINNLIDYGISAKSLDFKDQLLHELRNCQHAKLCDEITGGAKNLVIRYGMKDHNGKFIGGRENIKSLQSSYYLPKSNYVTIYGLGGMGKTRLVAKFVSETMKSVHSLSCASLDCSNSSNFHTECASLGKRIEECYKIKLPFNLENLKSWSPKTLLARISNEIFTATKSKWVLILENCEESIIQHFELLGLLDNFNKEIMIIAISRIRSLGSEHAIEINAMNNKEANEYLNNLLGGKIRMEENLKKIQVICSRVYNYPIALEYAASNIKGKMARELCPMVSAMTEFIKQLENVKTNDVPAGSNEQFKLCLSETLKVTIDEIRISCDSPSALKLLQVLSHLKHIGITVNFLKKMVPFHNADEIFMSVLAILKQYLIITFADEEDLQLFELNPTAQGYLKTLCDPDGDALKSIKSSIIAMNDQILNLSELETRQVVHILPQILDDKENTETILGIAMNVIARLETFNLFRQKLDFSEIFYEWCNKSQYRVVKIGMGISKKHAQALLHFDYKDTAMTVYEEIYKDSCRTFGKEAEYSIGVLNSIGGIHHREKNHDDAMKCFEEVLVQQEQLYGSLFQKHPKALITKRNIATIHIELGKYAEAQQILKNVTEFQKNLDDDTEYLQSVRCLGYCFYKLDDFEQAVDKFREAIKCKNVQLKFIAQFNLGRSLLKIGSEEATQEGLALLQEVYIYQKHNHGEQHKDTLKTFKWIEPFDIPDVDVIHEEPKLDPGRSPPVPNTDQDEYSTSGYMHQRESTLLYYKENKAALKRKHFIESLQMKKRHREELNNLDAPYLSNP